MAPSIASLLLMSLCAVLIDGSFSTTRRELPTWQGETHATTERADNDKPSRSAIAGHPSLVREQLIMGANNRPRPSHHASTIVEAKPGELIAAWFAGTFEGKPDVGIWVSHFNNISNEWTKPQEVVAPHGIPTWNPVLFKLHNGQILLYYKVGRSPTSWRGFVKRSNDAGKVFGPPELLPVGIIGPAKNKPLQLKDGTILSPSSVEKPGPGKEWTCWVEESKDNGYTWKRHGPIELDGKIIQPALFLDDEDKVRMVMRSRKRYMASSTSDKHGTQWTRPRLTGIPCPNSGLDAVRLMDRHILLVYSHSFKTGVAGRGVLAVAMSSDDGDSWERILTLEDSGGRVLEYSYPAVIQAADGMVHITYSWRRHDIKHVILDPSLFRYSTRNSTGHAR